jgi:protein tyrosine/serine phosphatase
MERLQTRLGRFLAHLEAWLIDHEIIRVIYRNFHALSPQAWRSNQPSPRFVRKLHRRYQVRTIINLRGENRTGHYLLEKEACDRYGINLINHPISSRAHPSREQIHGLINHFQNAELPLLFHCKSGADRAGLAAVLYRHVILNHPIEEALQELHFLYGHFRISDTGKLDHFFDAYREALEENPHLTFLEWVDTLYDPKKLDQTFQSRGFGRFIVDSILRRE